MRIQLLARPPFSFLSVVGSNGWVELAPFSLDDQGALRYVDRLQSGKVVDLRITRKDDGVHVAIDDHLAEEEVTEVEAKVRWMLGLDQDLTAFYEMIRPQPKLAHIIKEYRGRLLRSPTLFEDVVKTILTTNTTWSGTIRMVSSLVSAYGEPMATDSGRKAFPSPARLAQADEKSLRQDARLGYRAPYVLELAKALYSQSMDLESLKSADITTGELRKQLLRLKGVGEYAAANLLMLLGRYDFVPIDSAALKVVSHEWYGGEPIEASLVEAAFERWGKWKGLVYWFWDWSYFRKETEG